MIKPHSDDPNVAQAADQAASIISETLNALPAAESFDYGGHILKIGEYDLCERCTKPIAEAQAAESAILTRAETTDNDTVKEHLLLAAELLRIESAAAIVRAEFHNGHNTEPILNSLLGFQYDRRINDDYNHNHQAGTTGA